MIRFLVLLCKKINEMSWKKLLLIIIVSSVIFGYSGKIAGTFLVVHSPYFYTMVRNEAMDTKERDRMLDAMYKSYVSKMSTNSQEKN
ncbi:MAG: hypothetical protein HGA87_07220 [Desulfobulbaceae bacterium]|nr:hypothetical protein [Desulfobulbaceae bacterium]